MRVSRGNKWRIIRKGETSREECFANKRFLGRRRYEGCSQLLLLVAVMAGLAGVVVGENAIMDLEDRFLAEEGGGGLLVLNREFQGSRSLQCVLFNGTVIAAFMENQMQLIGAVIAHVKKKFFQQRVDACKSGDFQLRVFSDVYLQQQLQRPTSAEKLVTSSSLGGLLPRLIFPGTKWCGDGDRASGGRGDLGLFEGVDRCCQTHDHCPAFIEGRGALHGIRNSLPFTMSRCDCDDIFYACLKDVPLGSGKVVAYNIGKTYFNVLKVPCFRLAHPQGTCEEYREAGVLQKLLGSERLCTRYVRHLDRPKKWQVFPAKMF